MADNQEIIDEKKPSAKKTNQSSPTASAKKKSSPAKKSSQTQVYEAKITELHDKLLRSIAECDNIRKRAEQEIAKARHFAIESFAKDMVSVLENLYRALESTSLEECHENSSVKTMIDGIEMTKKEMLSALEKHQIQRIFPKGEIFDHNIHQAISQLPGSEEKTGTVLDVVQAGYTIKGRLLKPAMVIVAG